VSSSEDPILREWIQEEEVDSSNSVDIQEVQEEDTQPHLVDKVIRADQILSRASSFLSFLRE
jgi:hypothetical protein